jgi:monofunctional biosynthetic peptidoglycan transglycosylase
LPAARALAEDPAVARKTRLKLPKLPAKGGPRRGRTRAAAARRRPPPPWRRRALRVALAALGVWVLITAVPVLVLRFVRPLTTTFMLRSYFSDPASGRPCDRVQYRWTDGASISRDLALAVVLAEDQRFLTHDGFDFDGIRRALRERVRRGRVRGASTITQQLAKNLFLWPEASWLRKGIEAWFTVLIELTWPKQRILEVYLNVVQFGPCVYGAGAASETYFGRPPSRLEPAQAALLAAVLPNPYKLRAHAPGAYARQRTQRILALMSQHAWLRRQL